MKKSDYVLLLKLLQEYAPHGHPDFIPNAVEAIRLHSDKSWDYAGEGDPLGNFNRVAAMCDALFTDGNPLDLSDPQRNKPLMVLLTYMAKQFDAIIDATGHGRAMKVEELSGKLTDISIYAQLGRIMVENAR